MTKPAQNEFTQRNVSRVTVPVEAHPKRPVSSILRVFTSSLRSSTFHGTVSVATALWLLLSRLQIHRKQSYCRDCKYTENSLISASNELQIHSKQYHFNTQWIVHTERKRFISTPIVLWIHSATSIIIHEYILSALQMGHWWFNILWRTTISNN